MNVVFTVAEMLLSPVSQATALCRRRETNGQRSSPCRTSYGALRRPSGRCAEDWRWPTARRSSSVAWPSPPWLRRLHLRAREHPSHPRGWCYRLPTRQLAPALRDVIGDAKDSAVEPLCEDFSFPLFQPGSPYRIGMQHDAFSQFTGHRSTQRQGPFLRLAETGEILPLLAGKPEAPYLSVGTLAVAVDVLLRMTQDASVDL